MLALAGAGHSQTSAGSAACSTCHAQIYRSYQTTPMARSARKLDASSVPERFDHASFTHIPSGYRYRVFLKNSEYFLEFTNSSNTVTAAKPLAYAIGSGTRAFSYLFEEDGFLYEAPVAYYATGKSWGLAPGYEGYSYPYLTRPIAPGCLSCHASSVEATPMTLNGYASPAFLEGGIACERCHGDGARHIAKMQSGNLAGGSEILIRQVRPPRRDSVCAQCHLTGDVRVMRPGTTGKFSPRRAVERFSNSVCPRPGIGGHEGHRSRRESGAERLQAQLGRPAFVGYPPRSSHRATSGSSQRLVSRKMPHLPRHQSMHRNAGGTLPSER